MEVKSYSVLSSTLDKGAQIRGEVANLQKDSNTSCRKAWEFKRFRREFRYMTFHSIMTVMCVLVTGYEVLSAFTNRPSSLSRASYYSCATAQSINIISADQKMLRGAQLKFSFTFILFFSLSGKTKDRSSNFDNIIPHETTSKLSYDPKSSVPVSSEFGF